MFFFSDAVKCTLSGPDLECKPGGKYMERWQFLAHAGSSANLANFYLLDWVSHTPPVINKDSDKNGTNVEIDQTRDTTKCT